jgi:AsmA-like C-terminal region
MQRHRVIVWSFCLALPILVLTAIGVHLIAEHWPYRHRNVLPLLESVLASKVKIDHYHRIYFPYPGFVAENVTLRRNSAANFPPIGTIRELLVQGDWLDLLLFRKRVRLVKVTGLHVVIPPVGSPENYADFPAGSSADFAGPSTAVEQLQISESSLEVVRTNGSRYRFPIRELTIRNLQSGNVVRYSVDMDNAIPAGRIRATGSFGPLIPRKLAATPLTGDFTFSQVRLEDVGAIRGALTASGHFSGVLDGIETFATASTPNFAVSKGQPTPIAGSTHCTINGLNGGVILHSVEAQIATSTVYAHGDILGSPKVADLEFSVTKGHAQGILRPFLRDQVPITGIVSLHGHAHVEAARQGESFLQRLKVDGGFDVPAGRLTDRSKEQALTSFSKRAVKGKTSQLDRPSSDAEATGSASNGSADVFSSIGGQVQIRNGIASSQNLTFRVSGAAAYLHGDYDLRNGIVRLAGNLHMESDVSHVTTGFKSLLLKPLAPFFKRSNAGAVIPIAIAGGPNEYKVTQNVVK